MFRRSFLADLLLPPLEPTVLTVRGPVEAHRLGFTLPHEHLFSQFGAPPQEPPSYDTPQIFNAVLPELKQLAACRVSTIIDCTAAYFGRDPRLLRQLSDRSGIDIITNTGYYGAAKGRYIPESAQSESAEEIAQRWTAEFESGIIDGIRPGFLKLGVEPGPLSPLHAKLLHAAALTHRRTGMTIAVHTGPNPESALAQLDILERNRVSPKAWIWTHANQILNTSDLSPAARRGAWISLDGINPQSAQRHLDLLARLLDAGFRNQILLSHDGNLKPAAGAPRRLTYLSDLVLPKLGRDAHTLTVANPAACFALAIRSA
jgi:phosphotriesterase-related protein